MKFFWGEVPINNGTPDTNLSVITHKSSFPLLCGFFFSISNMLILYSPDYRSYCPNFSHKCKCSLLKASTPFLRCTAKDGLVSLRVLRIPPPLSDSLTHCRWTGTNQIVPFWSADTRQPPSIYKSPDSAVQTVRGTFRLLVVFYGTVIQFDRRTKRYEILENISFLCFETSVSRPVWFRLWGVASFTLRSGAGAP